MSGGGSGDLIRKMADLLRSGAAMLGERCPLCGVPLFRLKSGEVVCPVHGRVYIVRDESERGLVTAQAALELVERSIASRILSLDLQSLSAEVLEELDRLLRVLERVERVLLLLRSRSVSVSRPGGGGGSGK